VTIYRVHVSLREIDPPIWRLLELSSRTTLKQFHRMLQIAMGWEDSHLHEYIVDGQRYGTPDRHYDDPGDVVPETGVRLERVLPEPGATMLYLYDFGDYWEHEIRLESVSAAVPGATYPLLVGGARSCPPEDCGGVRGYAALLEILIDPEHKEFEQMRAWVGSRFNAEVFSMAAVSQHLRRDTSLRRVAFRTTDNSKSYNLKNPHRK
jgi:hypothetical protein